MTDRLWVAGLCKAYPGLAVLRGCDLALAAGEIVAICGASGTGKSTLLNCIGLLDRADAGSIHIDGERVDDLPLPQRCRIRARRLGFIFQGFHLLPEFAVLENVLMAARCADRQPAGCRAKALELLAAVGLADRSRQPVTTLSGGERQRVAICRALLLEPALVLADEPTGNLDPATGAQVFSLLADLARKAGSSVLIVTHESAIATACQRRYDLLAGRLALAESSG